MAAKSNSNRARIVANLAVGLSQVYLGEVESGISLLKSVLEETRTASYHLHVSILESLATAYQEVGENDLAVATLANIAALERESRKTLALLVHEREVADLMRGVKSDSGSGMAESQLAAAAESRDAKRQLLAATMKALENVAVASETAEDPTGEHIYRVGCLASLLAQELEFGDEFVFHLELAARLHDIGKLGIRQSLLAKDGLLTTDELAEVQAHVTYAGDLLGNVGGPLREVTADVARFHHERWDGTGYPEGRAGASIPDSARLVALADAFDSLTHWRPYRRAWPIWRALEEIERLAGTQFDPAMTKRFVALVRRLMSEHEDIDAYLSKAASSSEFIASRRALATWSRENQ
jgi:putative two-component system response regulator